MNEPTKIILKNGKDSSLLRFHPWVFSGAISRIIGSPKDGDIVNVFDFNSVFLGKGHFNSGSIAVRIFSFENKPSDREFWKNKFLTAYNLRKEIGLTDNPETNVFRLINGEGDSMPGLIADYYNDNIVLQAHSQGMYQLRQLFTEILSEIFGEKLLSVYDKSSSTLKHLDIKDCFLFNKNNSSEIIVTENNNKFVIDIVEGQKTGFFIDQRINRRLLAKYVKDKKVLNLFCYSGAFSVYALRAGAALVHSVDSSAKAIKTLENNIQLNSGFKGEHKAFTADAISFSDYSDIKYDIIIVDPPAFAKHIHNLKNALQGYKNLNKKVIANIAENGIIFTFSCSQVVTRSNFREAVFSAAALAKRDCTILHQLTQPPDHPINIFHPEGEYLKGLVLNIN